MTLPVALLSLLLAAAVTDTKTGLHTHAAWQSIAAQAIAGTGHRRRYRPARWALLMIDLDHFTHLNNHYGHPAADALLRHLASTLRAASSPDAVIGRFGGDEFTVLLPAEDLADLQQRAEDLRRAVEAATVTATGPNGTVTITGITASIGGALLTSDVRDTGSQTWPAAALAEMLWAADRALYDAKHAGRNTIRVRPADDA